ncbi:glycyl-radical enzyme activating protein [Sunxiuqinia sp. A32]|uniref:glycyl-radical enzyme activating protein n=1 Tax=Sunxiuqinia sp. A32 TaxID=3461496 RepID=UPI004045E046
MVKNNSMEGKIFKIKRFCVHDGPGIRTSVFLKGCPMKCVWCHSPEGISSGNSLWYNKNLCISCALCVNACPTNSLLLTGEPVSQIEINRKTCNLSGECITICPTNALQFTGYKATVNEIVEEIEKDLTFYQKSGGGVTLTGGEALHQPEFTTAILKACKDLNIHTTIETCLYCDREAIDQVLPYVDLFFVDIKIFDTKQHKLHTGRNNEKIKDNFRYLATTGKKIIVRIPLISDITDTVANKTAIKNFVSEIDENIPIELINYNPLTENNYARLGIPFLLQKNK